MRKFEKEVFWVGKRGQYKGIRGKCTKKKVAKMGTLGETVEKKVL